jgi:hypothetical protein
MRLQRGAGEGPEGTFLGLPFVVIFLLFIMSGVLWAKFASGLI